MRRRAIFAAILVLGSALMAGCDDDDDGPGTGGSTGATTSGATDSGSAKDSGDWVTITDPVEQAFTVELPAGWKNDAYVKRDGINTISVATTESPDGGVALFYGDPKMPRFVEPAYALPQTRKDPNVRIEPYTPAETFLPGYVKKRFAKLPGFRILGTVAEPELVEKNRVAAQKAGAQLTELHSARVDFEFTDGGKTRRGSVFGTTFSLGMIWATSVAGIVSGDDPAAHRERLFYILDSIKALPEWKEKERLAAADRQRQHEYVMAQIARGTEQLKINHQNNMATLRGMAARHQLRMDAIHAAGDASMAAYRARDAASDNNQQGFLNYLKDEHTVGTTGGQTFQVDNRYDRYYVNKNDNSYIGLKGGTTLNDLNGVNPGDYEEARILR